MDARTNGEASEQGAKDQLRPMRRDEYIHRSQRREKLGWLRNLAVLGCRGTGANKSAFTQQHQQQQLGRAAGGGKLKWMQTR